MHVQCYVLIIARGVQEQRDLAVEPEWAYPQYPAYGYGAPPFMHPYQPYPQPPSSSYAPRPPPWEAAPPPYQHPYPYAGYAPPYGTPVVRTHHPRTGNAPVGSSASGGSKVHEHRERSDPEQCEKTELVDCGETRAPGTSLPATGAVESQAEQPASHHMAASPVISPQVRWKTTVNSIIQLNCSRWQCWVNITLCTVQYKCLSRLSMSTIKKKI